MTISAYALDNPHVAHLRYRDNTAADLGSMQMYCHMIPDSVSIHFTGRHRRPVVRLKGMVSKMVPTEYSMEQAHLFGIDEVDFVTGPQSQDASPRMVCDYKIDDEQMKALIDKGFYENSFELPNDVIMGYEMRVPVDVNFHVAQPEDNTVVLMYKINDLRTISVTKESCGFDLAEHCESVYQHAGPSQSAEHSKAPQTNKGRDMFADVAFEDDGKSQSVQSGMTFEDTTELSHDDSVPPYERIEQMAVGQDLEFPETYVEKFPSEDYVPKDISERQDALDNAIKEAEQDPIVSKFYDDLHESREDEDARRRARQNAVQHGESLFEDVDHVTDSLSDDELSAVESELSEDRELADLFSELEDEPDQEIDSEFGDPDRDPEPDAEVTEKDIDEFDHDGTPAVAADDFGDIFSEDYEEERSAEEPARRVAVEMSNDAVVGPTETESDVDSEHDVDPESEVEEENSPRAEQMVAAQKTPHITIPSSHTEDKDSEDKRRRERDRQAREKSQDDFEL